MTVADLLAALKRRWPLVLLAGLVALLGAQRYSASLPPQYQAFAVLSLTLEPDVSAGPDLIRLEVQRYAVSLAAPSGLAQVARQVGVDVDEVEDDVEITTPPDTGNIRIGVQGDSPVLPAVIANRLAAHGVALSEPDPLLRVSVSAAAVPAREPSGPARSMIAAAGGVLGLLAGAGLVLLSARLRPRVHDLGTLTRHATPLPVLGVLAPRRLAGAGSRAVVRRVRTLLAAHPPGAVRTVGVVEVPAGAGSAALAAALARSLTRSSPAAAAAPRDRDGDPGRPGSPPAAALLRLTRTEDDALPAAAALQQAGEGSRWVLVDGGPVLDEAALDLLPAVDAAVLVVARGAPLRPTVEALDALTALHVRVLGVVLSTGQGTRSDEAGPRGTSAVAPPARPALVPVDQ